MDIARIAATTRGVVTEFLIRPDEAVTLGRSRSCTVPLRDRKVSRRHCQLSFARHQVVVVDLDSSHGILHLGVRQQMFALAPGDGVHLGDTFVRFVAVDAVDDAVVAEWFGPGGRHERLAPSLAEDDDGDDIGAADDAVPAEAAAIDLAPAAAAPVSAAPTSAPPASSGSGWGAFVAGPSAPPADVVLLTDPIRRGAPPGPRPASASKTFTARLAAEAIVSAMHMVLCIAILALAKLAFGFDVYRLFGIAS